MKEKVTLDLLTQNGVTIGRQKMTVVDGAEYPIGNVLCKAYTNSARGRDELIAEVEEPYKSIILMMWGETPTIIE